MEATPSPAAAPAEPTPAYFKGRLGYLTAEEEQALRDLWKLVLQACGVHPDFPERAAAAAVPETPPTPTTPTTPGDAPKRRWPSLWGAGARAKTPEPGSGAADAAADPAAAKAGRDFLHQLRIGKAVVRGVDRQGRPICTIRAREHFAKAQDFEVLKRWIVYIIETARLGFEEGKDRSTVIFDLTGVGMSNVDLQPVWFIAKAFEANYPEMLNRVIVHKAPGFFPYFFNMIIRQLKEEIREKIDFTNSFEDLATHIEPATIPQELGGPVAWTYAYAEPAAGENAAMADTAARDAVQATRDALARDWEAATLEWLRLAPSSSSSSSSSSAPPNGADVAPAPAAPAPAPEVAAAPPGDVDVDDSDGKADAVQTVQARRRAIAARLRANYWDLDPYVRARSMWDRLGYLQSDGSIDYFAADKVRPGGASAEPAAPAEAGAPVAAQA